MTLKLDNGYEIRSYDHGWMLGQNKVQKAGKGVGTEKFYPISYPSTLRGAAQALLARLIHEDDTIYVNDVKTLVQRINSLEQNLNKQLGLED